jgi:hypothetical protein
MFLSSVIVMFLNYTARYVVCANESVCEVFTLELVSWFVPRNVSAVRKVVFIDFIRTFW